MGWESDAATAYDNELRAAERHMEGRPRSGGKCWECDHFHEIQASDELSPGLARQLDFCGACVADGTLTIVDRSEEHSADECWEEDTHD